MLELLLDSEETEYLYKLLLNDFNSDNRSYYRDQVQFINYTLAKIETRFCHVSSEDIAKCNRLYKEHPVQIKYAQINMTLLACMDRMMPLMNFTEIEEEL